MRSESDRPARARARAVPTFSEARTCAALLLCAPSTRPQNHIHPPRPISTMKRSAKANAITNSPFVRALIQPVMRKIVPAAALPPPSQADLIPTQPVRAVAAEPVAGPTVEVESVPTQGLTVNGASEKALGKKRAREEDWVGEGEEVVVSYTKDNLPQELDKCK